MAENKPGGVQSVTRALDILEAIDGAGGELALIDIAAASGLPTPTIHRLVRTLVDRGYLRQLPDRRYALGSRLIPLGSTALTAFGSRSAPELRRLVSELGETANLATLDGDQVVYVGQVPSPHAMRMFTDLGRHVPAHCRATGKALLSQLPDEQIRTILRRTGMPAFTPCTITSPDELLTQLATVRERGWAVDEGELEEGVVCLAVPVPSSIASLAVSISGPAVRVDERVRARSVPLLTQVAADLAAQLDVASA